MSDHPHPRLLVVQKTQAKTPCTKSLSMFRGVFVRGFVRGFWSGRFCPGGFCPFSLLSEYLRYNRKLNITFNFTFHMYDKKFKKCDVTCSWTPSSVTNCHTFSDPLTPSSMTYFMDGPSHVTHVNQM